MIIISIQVLISMQFEAMKYSIRLVKQRWL